MTPLKQRTPGGDPGHTQKIYEVTNGKDNSCIISPAQSFTCRQCAFYELITRKSGYKYGLCHFTGAHDPQPGQNSCRFIAGTWSRICGISVEKSDIGVLHGHKDAGQLVRRMNELCSLHYDHMDYRFDGKRKLLSFGEYPAITLKMAREKREEAKRLLAEGIDPGEHKKQQKAIREAELSNTFENIAREWHSTQTQDCTEANRTRKIQTLEKHCFPAFGNKPIAVQQICKKAIVEARKLEQAFQAKMKQRQKAVFVPTVQTSPQAAYFAHYENIRAHLTVEDFSRVDAMIALRMRANGHSPEAVLSAIKDCAPTIRTGMEKRRDWQKYAERTADYAFGFAGDRDLLKIYVTETYGKISKNLRIEIEKCELSYSYMIIIHYQLEFQKASIRKCALLNLYVFRFL